MKKLFTTMTLFLSAAFLLAGCDDGQDSDSEKLINIPQNELQVTVDAGLGMKHTINFEAKQAWTASVANVRSNSWITISPTSGSAGKNAISVTFTQNPAGPRKATVTIECGSKLVHVSITQESQPGPYLTNEEIVEEGTLNYVADRVNPDAHYAAPNCYTSYTKIRSTLSDGTSTERTESREVVYQLAPEFGSLLDYINLLQEQVDNFKLTSTVLGAAAPEEGTANPYHFTFTLEYNCFTVEMKGQVDYPYCEIYSAEKGEIEIHRMPMLPFDKNSITCRPPKMEKKNGEPSQDEYYFSQEYLLQVNPDATEIDQYIQQINRFVYVNL